MLVRTAAEHLGFQGVRPRLDDQLPPSPLLLWDAEPHDGSKEGEAQVLLQVIGSADGRYRAR